jgi:mannose-6-phosphate isomerase-like protein (cupin superfamily)
VINGEGFFRVGDKERLVKVGDEEFIDIGFKHQIKAGEMGLEVLEISLGEFEESDIFRYEDKYNRV